MFNIRLITEQKNTANTKFLTINTHTAGILLIDAKKWENACNCRVKSMHKQIRAYHCGQNCKSVSAKTQVTQLVYDEKKQVKQLH